MRIVYLDTADNQLLRNVNDVIPRTLPEQVRADVGQELLLAVLDGQISVYDVAAYVQPITRRIWAQQQSRFSEISLESMLGESGRRLEETLVG